MGVYSTSNAQWELFKHASMRSGEVWRIIFDISLTSAGCMAHATRTRVRGFAQVAYRRHRQLPQVRVSFPGAQNRVTVSTRGRSGGSVVAATFLEKFVKRGTPWMHIDMAGVMHNIPVPCASIGLMVCTLLLTRMQLCWKGYDRCPSAHARRVPRGRAARQRAAALRARSLVIWNLALALAFCEK